MGFALVAMQGALAEVDNFLTQKQMLNRRVHRGYSFMEHGGMWADVFIISPITSFILVSYQLEYIGWKSLALFALSTAITFFAGNEYKDAGLLIPEAHAHDGKTTPAGIVHGFYAIVTLWIIMLYYFTGPIEVEKVPMIRITWLLTAFFPLGVVKFNRQWRPTLPAVGQVVLLDLTVWTVCIIRCL